ncbi:MAG: hypothetical protein JSU65_04665, partial [Candidatus Zixiibacteriota bacterium]
TRYLLSFGPFDIDPGERLPISFAYIAGEGFHVDPNNIVNLPHLPDAFYDNINFSDLGLNAAWSGRIYDNPGVDTDGDDYFGKVRVCCNDEIGASLDDIEDTVSLDFFNGNDCDVIWYEGDGIPDFRGAAPPPAPQFWLEPDVGSIRVRLNGLRSETAKDVFSRKIDFEGYRLYIGRDERESSFSLVASYDREDYNKYVLVDDEFVLLEQPFTLEELRCLYASSCDDTTFLPLLYDRSNPFRHPLFEDSLFYFDPQDFNVSTFGVLTPIRKIYPDQPYPSSLNPDSANPNELTDDGYFKYFEYEHVIENLLPTVLYWVNVTAFDFGSPQAELEALESSVTSGAKATYANATVQDVAGLGLKVYAYPNPYRADADYRAAGFEGRMDSDRPDDRVRAIHFANLPPKC